MEKMTQYRRRERTTVIAVQLDLDTEGFTYEKWGGTQRCKSGDWLLNNQGDTYTVDRETFEATYARVSPGVYEKVAPVYARQADAPGVVKTKEGTTDYEAGDFIVCNREDGGDAYAVAKAKFDELYEPADG